MDEELERLVIAVRADTRGFAGDVAGMRGLLEEQIGGGADVAGRAIERALGRAIRSGKLGFDDLRQAALSVLAEIARGAVTGAAGSLGGLAGTLLGALGLPGRATGGPVSPGRPHAASRR